MSWKDSALYSATFCRAVQPVLPVPDCTKYTLDSADAHWLLCIVHHHQWIQRVAIVLALSLTLLAFLTIIQQHMERFDLNSPSTQCPHLPKVYRKPELWMPLYSRHVEVVPVVSALEGLHYIKCPGQYI